jgi:hypothetical protein
MITLPVSKTNLRHAINYCDNHNIIVEKTQELSDGKHFYLVVSGREKASR